jgi:hypothetical protein
MIRFAAAWGTLLLGSTGLRAQGPATKAMQDVERRAAQNISEAVEAMPQDRFAFKPTPDQMSFGELVLHVASANITLCSALARISPPVEHMPALTDPKDLVVRRLRASFDVCRSALEHSDDSFLEDTIPSLGRRPISRGAALVELATVWADHYSQLAMYLRLNGLTPPTAKPH